MSKNTGKRRADLLLIGVEGKRNNVLIKDFNTFKYDHTLHPGRKNFCHYCLQDFSTEVILKCHGNECFKINGKQIIKMSKKGEYVRFKKLRKESKVTIYDLCRF